MNALVSAVVDKDLRGSLATLAGRQAPFEVRVHRLYNPEGITQYNIIPGLMGVILTMTLVMMTGLAMTRERERGTMENLLATPVLPIEVMSGKIVPYIAIGLIQATIILLAARWVFGVPFVGSVTAIYLAATRDNAIWRVPLMADGSATKVGAYIRMSGGGGPDGIALDAQGGLAVCHVGFGAVWLQAARSSAQAMFRMRTG